METFPDVSLSIYSIDVQANAIVLIDLSKCLKLESTGAIKWAVFISPGWLFDIGDYTTQVKYIGIIFKK